MPLSHTPARARSGSVAARVGAKWCRATRATTANDLDDMMSKRDGRVAMREIREKHSRPKL